ncbi:MAG: thioredoxin family protein, partial [Candidatus Eremiobacterota bacterium]
MKKHLRLSILFCIIFLGFLTINSEGKCLIINEDDPGSRIKLEDYIVPGQINIIDFYADWCNPCKKIAPHLEDLDKRRDDVVVLKVNIDTWDSPVCRQFTIKSVPSFLIYD